MAIGIVSDPVEMSIPKCLAPNYVYVTYNQEIHVYIYTSNFSLSPFAWLFCEDINISLLIFRR